MESKVSNEKKNFELILFFTINQKVVKSLRNFPVNLVICDAL